MDHFLFQDKPPDERKRILRDSADSVEETTYQKPLTEEQVALRRERHSNNCIEISKKADDLAEAKSTYKAAVDPMIKANKSILSELKHKQATMFGMLFTMLNHEERQVYVYDETGELISSRRMRPDERQLTIPLSKAQ